MIGAAAALFDRRPRTAAWAAAAFYLAYALFATWPLALGLGRDVASDFGDPLLNMWILAWDSEQLRAILGGDFARVSRFFDANIFYPAPLTLAYSEHLVPQAIQILPLYLLTGNIILCYNLLFLSTYVLSAVGGYLLVRELTGGDWRAAFIGGLLFGFALYRAPQAPHLQVISAQWMPFALYGLTRYLNTRRYRALAGGTLAAVLQALSCGYYLLFFVPFVAAYGVWEIVRRRLFGDRRIWRDLVIAAVAAAALLTPFLLPYAWLREAGRFARGLNEVEGYSADVYAYFTALAEQRIWGGVLEAFPKSEGQLFQGAVPMILGVVALALWGERAWRAGREHPGRHGVVAAVLGTGIALCVIFTMATIFQRRLTLEMGLFVLRINDVGRVLLWGLGLLALLLWISPRARARFRALGTVEGFFCLSAVAAWWLSLGPQPRVLGRTLEMPSLYGLFYDMIPGFDGLRVPARFAMVVALMLAVVSAMAAATLLRRWPRVAGGSLALLCVLFLIEAPARQFPINGTTTANGYRPPEPRVYRRGRAPAVYQRMAEVGGSPVLLEFPIGETSWDLRSVYYSTVHWSRLVNGYSGFFPPSYGFVVLAFADPARVGDISWQALRSAGVSHVIVHEAAYLGEEPAQIKGWLRAHGAREIAREGSDVLYAVTQRAAQSPPD